MTGKTRRNDMTLHRAAKHKGSYPYLDYIPVFSSVFSGMWNLKTEESYISVREGYKTVSGVKLTRLHEASLFFIRCADEAIERTYVYDIPFTHCANVQL